MAQQQLNAQIVLRGSVEGVNSISKALDSVGNSLINLGYWVDRVSEKLIDFGMDSLTLFRDYQDGLLAVKGIWSQQYEDIDDLNAVIESLDSVMRGWAATTRYTASEVITATVEAARAGWDYNEIMAGMPTVMDLAAAANMDLASATDYVVSALAVTDTSFEDSQTLIDQWVKAANNSKTTIEQLGMAVDRMGATAQYTESTAELYTLLANLANYGIVGSQAGTLLRSAMIRLVAPTSKAADAFELLGATDDEISELLMDTESLAKAASILEEKGFSPYDDAGDLRSMMDIFSELNEITGELTEEERNTLLGAIFPTRTMATAMNLLQAASDEYNGLYETILDSEGYADSIAKTQESGIGGALRILRSQWQELQLTVGEGLAPDVMIWADAIGDIVMYLAELDDETKQRWITVFEGIAVAGPALLLMGGGLKMLAWLATPQGMAAAAAVGAITIALNAYNDKQQAITNAFGTLEMDMDTFSGYVATLTSEFAAQIGTLDQYGNAVLGAVTDYKTASRSLTGSLFTSLITGATLTPDDLKTLQGYGQRMVNATIEGITASEMGSAAFLKLFWGDTPENEEYLAEGLDVSGGYFADLYADAYSVGEELRAQLVAALQDGELDENEYDAIWKTVERLNKINAEIADYQNRIAYETLLRQGQTVSIDSLEQMSEKVADQMNKELTDAENKYLTSRAQYKLEMDDQIAAATTDKEKERLATERDAYLSAMDEQWAQREEEVRQNYDSLYATMWRAAITSSGYSGYYDALREAIAAGDAEIYTDYIKDNKDFLGSILQNGEPEQLYEVLSEMEELYGGMDSIIETAKQYVANGEQLPDYMRTMLELYVMKYGLSTTDKSNFILGDWLTEQGYQDIFDILWNGSQTIEMEGEIGIDVEPDGTTAGEQYETDFESAAKPVVDVQIGPGGGGYNKQLAYAEGGRATAPSIFGEGTSAEWAIPEEHTSRTAELLAAAAAASGFTWGELLGATGGLNAKSGNIMKLVYAPVIHANDARGVEDVLRQNKEEMRMLLNEIKEDDARLAF